MWMRVCLSWSLDVRVVAMNSRPLNSLYSLDGSRIHRPTAAVMRRVTAVAVMSVMAMLVSLSVVRAQDQCNSALTCGQCESAVASLNCGWCSSSNVCSGGSNTGPATGSCTGTWTFQVSDTQQTE